MPRPADAIRRTAEAFLKQHEEQDRGRDILPLRERIIVVLPSDEQLRCFRRCMTELAPGWEGWLVAIRDEQLPPSAA